MPSAVPRQTASDLVLWSPGPSSSFDRLKGCSKTITTAWRQLLWMCNLELYITEKEEKVIAYRLICYKSNAYCIVYMKAKSVTNVLLVTAAQHRIHILMCRHGHWSGSSDMYRWWLHVSLLLTFWRRIFFF